MQSETKLVEKSPKDNKGDVVQSEQQALVIRNSHDVNCTQTEVQGLLLIQAALQAAIQAAILSFGDSDNEALKNLKKLNQQLDLTQVQSQGTYIEDCDGIVITQTEVQVDVVVQAAIQLLAKLSLASA